MYDGYCERSVANSIWGKIIIDYAIPAVAHCVNLCESSLSMLGEADDKLKNKLVPIIEDDLIYFQTLQNKLLGDDWDAIVSAAHSFSAKQLRAPKRL